MSYGLTEDGRQTALGVVSAICHGHDLDTVAALNGLDDADDVRILLMLILNQAGIIEADDYFDEIMEEE